MGIKHTFRVKHVVKYLGEAVLEWGFDAYKEKMLYFLIDLTWIIAVFYREVGLSGFEIRTGSISLWSCLGFFLFSPGVHLFLAGLRAALPSVLGLILTLCLSFPAWCSPARGLVCCPAWRAVLSEGVVVHGQGWAACPRARSCLLLGRAAGGPRVPEACQHCSALWAGDLR